MSDIMFDCPECGGSLEVDAAGAGMTVNCPQCSKPILIPQPVTSARLKLSLDDQLAWWRMAPSLKLDIDTKLRGGERLNMDEVLSSKPVAPNLPPASPAVASQKSCPFCGEAILAVAKKCKHCGSMLDGSGSAKNVTVTGKDPFAEFHTPIQGKKKGRLTVIGALGVWLGILAMGASIASCSMGYDPDQGEGLFLLFLFGVGFAVASFLWARK